MQKLLKSAEEKSFQLFLVSVAVFCCFFLFSPFAALLKETDLVSIIATFQEPAAKEILSLTMATSLVSTAIAAILGTVLAYILAYYDFPGKGLVDAFTTLPLVLPPAVAGYMLLLAFGRFGLIGYFFYQYLGWQILFTTPAIIIAQTFVILPFVVRTVKASLEAINPNLDKAAFSLGCSSYQILAWVRLPLAKYGIITGVTMAFARAMGEFGATVMVAGTQETMPLAIYTAANAGERELANVLSLLLILISFLTIYLVRGVTTQRLN